MQNNLKMRPKKHKIKLKKLLKLINRLKIKMKKPHNKQKIQTRHPTSQLNLIIPNPPKNLESLKLQRKNLLKSPKQFNNTEYKIKSTLFPVHKLLPNTPDIQNLRSKKTKSFFKDSKSTRNTYKKSPRLETTLNQPFIDLRTVMKILIYSNSRNKQKWKILRKQFHKNLNGSIRMHGLLRKTNLKSILTMSSKHTRPCITDHSNIMKEKRSIMRLCSFYLTLMRRQATLTTLTHGSAIRSLTT